MTKFAEFHSYVKPQERPVLSKHCKTFLGISQRDVDEAPVLAEALQKLHKFVFLTMLRASPEHDKVIKALAHAADPGKPRSGGGSDTATKEPDSEVAAGGGGGESSDDESSTAATTGPPSGGAPSTLRDLYQRAREEATSLQPCALFGHTFAFATDGPWDLLKFMHAECERKRIPKPLALPYLDKWVNTRWIHSEAVRFGLRRDNVEYQLKTLGLRFVGTPHRGLDDTNNIARIAAALILRRGARMRINDGVCKSMAVHFETPADWGKPVLPVADASFPPKWYGDGHLYPV